MERITMLSDFGTCLQGTVFATYNQLVSLLGESDPPSADDKVQHSWYVKDGKFEAEIYDWKSSAAYYGKTDDGTFESKYGYGPDEKYAWHIGAKNAENAEQIKSALLKHLN